MPLLSRIISWTASHRMAKAATDKASAAGSKYSRTPNMSSDQMSEFLSTQRVVRIAFDANGERYLIPLGYVWKENALYCMTKRGRKTVMAAANPNVSFQVDDSCETRLFIYKSVTGHGVFEIVSHAGEIERIMPDFAARFPDTPAWVQEESAALWVKGELVLARIRPQAMSGICYAPPDEGIPH